jgi:Zn-dependent protease with chaperone function
MSRNPDLTAALGLDPNEAPIVVDPWPSEQPLFGLSILVALALWVVIVVSIIGAVYAVVLGIFFGIVNLAFIAHVRGNAVRIGPEQFPELHGTIERLSRRMGLSPAPEAYLMQAGGNLNAFATKFLGSSIIVLFSDLLDACGEDKAARDMIIAHELGHVRSGHLTMRWFLLPSAFVPFLASALSRAREYTCDRFGLAGAGNPTSAGLGLAILAAGATHGPKVNRAELVRQRLTLSRSGLMTLGEWFASHPPIAKRLAAIDPSLVGDTKTSVAGPSKALLLVLSVPAFFVALIGGAMSMGLGDKFRDAMLDASVQQAGTTTEEEEPEHVVPPNAAEIATTDITKLVAFIEEERRRGGIPWNASELERRFTEVYPRATIPVDPYDGQDYWYDQRGQHYVVASTGPDKRLWTADDIKYESRVGRVVGGTR